MVHIAVCRGRQPASSLIHLLLVWQWGFGLICCLEHICLTMVLAPYTFTSQETHLRWGDFRRTKLHIRFELRCNFMKLHSHLELTFANWPIKLALYWSLERFVFFPHSNLYSIQASFSARCTWTAVPASVKLLLYHTSWFATFYIEWVGLIVIFAQIDNFTRFKNYNVALQSD